MNVYTTTLTVGEACRSFIENFGSSPGFLLWCRFDVVLLSGLTVFNVGCVEKPTVLPAVR